MTLKLDRSLISQLSSDAASQKIARKIIELANDLSLNIIAEGVEDSGAVVMLQEMGCNPRVFLGQTHARERTARLAGNKAPSARGQDCLKNCSFGLQAAVRGGCESCVGQIAHADGGLAGKPTLTSISTVAASS